MARSRIGLGGTVLTLAAALGFGGCLKAHDDVVLKADGAGTYAETLEIDVTAMQAFREAMRGAGRGGPGGPGAPGGPGMGEPGMEEPGMGGGAAPVAPAPPAFPSPDPTARIKARWKDIEGLEVTNSSSDEKDGKVTLHVEAKFTTLEAYARASGIEMGAELVKNDDGSYTLKFERHYGPGARGRRVPGGGPGMGADAPPEAPPGGMDGAPEAGMDGGEAPKGFGAAFGAAGPEIEKSLASLEVVRVLKLPGAITETNGTKSEDGTTVTWKVGLEDLKSGKAELQTVTFKGDGLDLKPFKHERAGRGMGGPRPPPPGGGGDR